MSQHFEELDPIDPPPERAPGDPEPSPGEEAPPTSPDYEQHEYRNKTVINQRGATVEINNSTDREELKLSQYSGSNIALTNVVNSELATNNKQVQVNNDSFESVGSDKNVYVGKDKVERVGENTYILRGFKNNTQLGAFKDWKENFKGIAGDNSQFRMLRGGFSFPNGVQTEKEAAPGGNDGTHWNLGRSNNPTINPINANRKLVLNNAIGDKDDDPELIAPTADEVADGSGGESGVGFARDIPQEAGITDDWTSKNIYGSQAPGVIQFGSEWSSATEGGRWKPNPIFVSQGELTKQQQDIIAIQNNLNDYELAMGNGGDEITFVKRHKIETIGAATNNYPSTRIDPKGRSQPLGIDVGENTSYENMDYISHVEEVDNDMAFPAGNYTLNVGNRYNVLVGSGGLQLKTSGSVEMGGAVTKIAGAQVTIQASSQTEKEAYKGPAGGGTVHIGSDGAVAIEGQKSVSLRSNRQVLVSPSLGVKRNLKVGGGTYIEGELYVHHITAPMVPKSVKTSGELLGKFNTNCPRELRVAEARLDIRKLKEQLDWVEQDDARRQAEADAKGFGPEGETLEQAQNRVAQEEKMRAGQDAVQFMPGVGDADGVKVINPKDVIFKPGEEGHDEFWVNRHALRQWVRDGNKEEDFVKPTNYDPRGEVEPGDDYLCWYPVFALPDENIIKMNAHTHEYEGLPIRSMASNADVRKIAMCEYINRDDRISHARKASDGDTPNGHGPISTEGIRGQCSTTYTTTTTPKPPDPPYVGCKVIPDCSCDETTPPVEITTPPYDFDKTVPDQEKYKEPDDHEESTGNSQHNNELLNALADLEFHNLGIPFGNASLPGVPAVPTSPMDEDGNVDPDDDRIRQGMEALREFWDNINRDIRNFNASAKAEADVVNKATADALGITVDQLPVGDKFFPANLELIYFPEIPDPRTDLFPDMGPWPAIPAGVWGPNARELANKELIDQLLGR